MKSLSVGFFENKLQGVGYYRLYQPLMALAKRGHQVYEIPDITDPTSDSYEKHIEMAYETLNNVDVLFVASPVSMAMFSLLATYKKVREQEGRPLILAVDFDDDVFNIDPFNNAYAFWGKHEVKTEMLGEVKQLWKASEKFNIEKNRKRLRSVIAILGITDVMFVTTARLKFVYRRFCKNIVIAPNGIDFNMFNADYKVKNDTDKIRLIWTLSASHFKDWADIRESLGNVLKQNPNVELVTIGSEFGLGRDIPLSQYQHIKWADNQAEYVVNLLGSQGTIGICALVNDSFNWKKSPLKWEELSALKIPCIVADVMYGDYVKDGVDGSVYKDKGDFMIKLNRLINDKTLRDEIAENAHNKIKEEYDIERIAEIYERAFYNIIIEVKK